MFACAKYRVGIFADDLFACAPVALIDGEGEKDCASIVWIEQKHFYGLRMPDASTRGADILLIEFGGDGVK